MPRAVREIKPEQRTGPPCPTCGRKGFCGSCCCVGPDHKAPASLPGKTNAAGEKICRRCGHPR